jgi:hypothetical protein
MMKTPAIEYQPTNQAFWLLRFAFILVPVLAGVDKIYYFLTGRVIFANWEVYLAPIFPGTLGVTPDLFMLAVGIIEVVAGIVVAVWPRWGGWIVGFWLWGIIVNFFLLGAYLDIALRDFGLSLAAFSLARLADARAVAVPATAVIEAGQEEIPVTRRVA